MTKRWLYWAHRWTGILLCILFAIWFVSGVVMMYVPFPSFRAEERVALAAPIRWDMVRIGPDAVLERHGQSEFPDDMRLEMTGGEPVYRFSGGDGRQAYSARTGQAIGPVDAREAMRIARMMTGTKPDSATLVERDQWVVTKAFARLAPFWRVRMADGAGTDIYVTRKTGEIVQNTDRWERFWNWLGAVPHWIYFEALRVYQEPWRQTVIWTSGIGVIGSILGIWIGILRVRLSKRYKSGSVSPYRGWMKWHHIAGLVGGVFLVTWVFSGWISMSPFGGLGEGDTRSIGERYTGPPAPRFATTDLSRLSQTAAGAGELRFDFVDGRPVILAYGKNGKPTALDGVTAQALHSGRAEIEARARSAVVGGQLVRATLLTRQDAYWYAIGDPRRDARPLPVWRFEFDDPHRSWLYVDPRTGLLVGQSNDGRRAYRWLFSALHSFDLPILIENRLIRDGLMILLSLAGLIISVSGVIVGWRYLRRRPPARKADARAAPEGVPTPQALPSR
jgi:uncharacterized iron-regulated membrane protein